MKNDTDIQEQIRNMPKIELHCHLDGSLSVEYVRNTLGLSISPEELKKKLVAPDDCRSLKEYLSCFDLPVKCLRTKKNITLGVMDVMRQAAHENVKYIEIRFAPALSLQDGLTYKDIYQGAIDGLQEGKAKYGIEGGIIACAMRHHSPETNMQVLKEAMPYHEQGICALDLAGDEAAFGNEAFSGLFMAANSEGMPFTIHSGECGRAENVKIALDYGARRIGHGIALRNDDELMKLGAAKGLGIEMCPTSNYQTKALSPGEAYPLRKFMDAGLTVCINTDNRTVSNTSMSRELYLCVAKLGLKQSELSLLYKNSIELSFASDSVKEQLRSLAP